jgi:hypothetical protein
MKRHVIDLFMFPYQEHFRVSIELLAHNVLKELGAAVEVKALLVGVRRPGKNDSHPVCVEPEKGRWKLSQFDGLLEAVEEVFATHPLQGMLYGDEPSNRDKPEWMRRDSATAAVRNAIRSYDVEHGVRSFCGASRLVGDYYVVPIVQVPESLFHQFPQLDERPPRYEHGPTGYRSMVDAALSTVLKEATGELERPEPGRLMFGEIRRPDEIVRIAANRFLDTPGLAISPQYVSTDLFTRLNLISSLLYERTKGIGRLLLAKPDSPNVEYLLRFRARVPFREPRWVRKVLQLASPDVVLVADSDYVYGLGRLLSSHSPSDQDVFMVEFLDHYTWELRCGDLPLIRCDYGSPSLPREALEKDTLTSSLERLFPHSTAADREQIWQLFIAAAHQDGGSMIVVADDAEAEADRLAYQGTGIAPVRLTLELLRQVSSIDGTVLLDPHANCHAIGVILDGSANDQCTPSRGSRFNSAVRYVRSGAARRLAIVVSEDRTIDVFPSLRPRMSRKQVDSRIKEFAASDVDSYHSAMNWLDERRFYLNAQQCEKINVHLERLGRVPSEVGELRYLVKPFKEDPEFESSYLTE